MTVAPARLRQGRPDEATTLRAFLGEVWQASYADISAPDLFAAHESWHSVETLSQQAEFPDASFLVAEDPASGQLVGHGFASPGTSDPQVLVVWRLFVLPSRQRQGIGTRLFAAISSEHPGFARQRLHALDDDGAALAFYARQGFRVIGPASGLGIPMVTLERPRPVIQMSS